MNNIKKAKTILKISSYGIDLIRIAIGTALMAAGTALFLLPNKLSTGGFSGIATIFYYFLNWNMGITIILLNMPLFIVACFKIGFNFLSKAVIGTTLLSMFIDIFTKFRTSNRRSTFSFDLWRNYNRTRNIYCIEGKCFYWWK